MNKITDLIQKEIDKVDSTAEGSSLDLRLDLSSLICKKLAENKWTQKELAHRVGMKESLLNRIIHGASNCTFETAGRILFALGIKGQLVDSGKCDSRSAPLELNRPGLVLTGDLPRRTRNSNA